MSNARSLGEIVKENEALRARLELIRYALGIEEPREVLQEVVRWGPRESALGQLAKILRAKQACGEGEDQDDTVLRTCPNCGGKWDLQESVLSKLARQICPWCGWSKYRKEFGRAGH
jgi:hypothetical protein